jgi:hypothetical protein
MSLDAFLADVATAKGGKVNGRRIRRVYNGVDLVRDELPNLFTNPNGVTGDGDVTLWENLITNPEFSAGTGSVEVRRNQWHDPAPVGFGITDNVGRWTRNSTTQPNQSIDAQGWYRLDATQDSTDGTLARGSNWGAGGLIVLPSTTYTLSFEMERKAGLGLPKFEWYEYTATGTAVGGRKSLTFQQDATTGRWFVTFTTAATVERLTPIWMATSNIITTGDWWRLRRTMLDASAFVRPYFDGGLQVTPDPDLTASWTATVNLSHSVLTGVPVAGVPSIPGRCLAIRSSKVARGVAYPLRLIADRNSNDTFVSSTLPAAAMTGGTLMATRWQDAVIPSPIARTLWVGTPEYTLPPVNVVGPTPYRLTFPGLTSNGGFRYYHGGAAGSADVYWAMGALVKGTYNGPWFSGSNRPHLRENLCKNPNFESATLTGWSGSGGVTPVLSTEWAMFGITSVKAVATTTNAAAGDVRYGTLTSFPDGLGPGMTFTASAYLNTPSAHNNLDTSGGSRQRRILVFFGGPGGSVTQTFGPQAPNVAGVNRISHTVTIPADATGVIVAVGCAGSSADVPFTSYFDGVLIEVSPALNPFFYGGSGQIADGYQTAWASTPGNSISYSYDQDFTCAWTATPGASTSIMKGVKAKGIVAYPGGDALAGAAIVSTRWSATGPSSIRLVTIGPAGGAMQILSPGFPYTGLATTYLEPGQPSSPPIWPSLASSGGVITSPITEGVHEQRVVSDGSNLLLLGVPSPGRSVWFDLLGMIPGEYDGPWFDGDSPGCGWGGVVNDSVSYGWK